MVCIWNTVEMLSLVSLLQDMRIVGSFILGEDVDLTRVQVNLLKNSCILYSVLSRQYPELHY